MSRLHWDTMLAHVHSCLPMEGCGLLAGHGDVVSEVIPIRNQAGSPTRFRMDPAEQIEAFSRMEAEGLDLLGIFHSHPAPPEAAALDHPSPSDIAESAYPVANIIWVRTNDGWQAHGYHIHAGGLTPVLLAVEDGEKRKES